MQVSFMKRRYVEVEGGPCAQEDGEKGAPNDIEGTPTIW